MTQTAPPTRARKTGSQHFYSLDALRGLAALGVVFWHWQHFFYRGTTLGPFTTAAQPLYRLFKPFYIDGWRAVDLFFCLSGFIFFWLYSDKIGRRETTPRQFIALRFSRLYPLHFATLLAVAGAQQFIRERTGSYFVYPHNDFFRFVLQLGFASNWFYQRDYSFNGSIWSVSIEVLLYAIFFIACWVNWRRAWHLLLFLLLGLVLIKLDFAPMLARGLLSYFAGGLAYQLFSSLTRAQIGPLLLPGCGILTILLWFVIPLNDWHNFLYRFYRSHVWRAALNIHGKDAGGAVLSQFRAFAFELVLFPLTIITLALWESQRGTFARRLAFLGNISYSSYLLHFPLQMIFVGVTALFAVPVSFYYTPLALGLFFAALIPLSLCSYHFFERPCQSWLRARTLRSKT
jgi:peptidoglycan/LPS O-acetylase OafA/YrhL